MIGIMNVTIGLAFFAGLASFLSPCVLALVPAYVSYLSGQTVLQSGKQEKSVSFQTIRHGFAFVLGFSLVFILIGTLAGAIGGLLFDITNILMRVGGIIVIIFGLHMLGAINIPFLNYDLRGKISPKRKYSYATSGLMGVVFSAGWAPCVGPILGTILTVSLNGGSISQGAIMLTAYSSGLAIPFLLAATQIGWVTSILRKYSKVMLVAEKTMGLIMVGIGILLFSGRLTILGSLGAFFDLFDEILVGQLLLIAVLASMLISLIPAAVARSRGKQFVDWWFLSAGVTLLVLVILYTLGAFNALIPTIT